MSSIQPRLLLVDYGEVISEPQPSDMVAEMASLVGLEVPEFRERYWRHRPAYDRGGQASTFWTDVSAIGTIEGPTLERLIKLDIGSWCLFNTDTLELLMDAHRQGRSISVLSNAPHELAVELSHHPAMAFFEQLIFSSWIGAVKPEPAAFEAAVRKLGGRPAEILFVDDRPANVEGAIDAGLRAVRFTSAGELRAELSL